MYLSEYDKGYLIGRAGGPVFHVSVTPAQRWAWLFRKSFHYRRGFVDGMRAAKMNDWNRRTDWDAA